MEISVICLTAEQIQVANLSNALKKVLYANIGRYIAVEETERGMMFFPKTLASSANAAMEKWQQLPEAEKMQ